MEVLFFTGTCGNVDPFQFSAWPHCSAACRSREKNQSGDRRNIARLGPAPRAICGAYNRVRVTAQRHYNLPYTMGLAMLDQLLSSPNFSAAVLTRVDVAAPRRPCSFNHASASFTLLLYSPAVISTEPLDVLIVTFSWSSGGCFAGSTRVLPPI